MRRREFITLVGSAAVWPAMARAQTTDRVRAIGVLATFAETDPNLVTFKNRLQELGWTQATADCNPSCRRWRTRTHFRRGIGHTGTRRYPFDNINDGSRASGCDFYHSHRCGGDR